MKEIKWLVQGRYRDNGERFVWSDQYHTRAAAERAIVVADPIGRAIDLWSEPILWGLAIPKEPATPSDEKLYRFDGQTPDGNLVRRNGLTSQKLFTIQSAFSILYPSGTATTAPDVNGPYEPRWTLDHVRSAGGDCSKHVIGFRSPRDILPKMVWIEVETSDIRAAWDEASRWLSLDARCRDWKFDDLYSEQNK